MGGDHTTAKGRLCTPLRPPGNAAARLGTRDRPAARPRTASPSRGRCALRGGFGRGGCGARAVRPGTVWVCVFRRTRRRSARPGLQGTLHRGFVPPTRKVAVSPGLLPPGRPTPRSRDADWAGGGAHRARPRTQRVSTRRQTPRTDHSPATASGADPNRPPHAARPQAVCTRPGGRGLAHAQLACSAEAIPCRATIRLCGIGASGRGLSLASRAADTPGCTPPAAASSPTAPWLQPHPRPFPPSRGGRRAAPS